MFAAGKHTEASKHCPLIPGAPLQVVSVASNPAGNRAAASATTDALSSAGGGLPSCSASLVEATPLGRRALQPHDPDTDDEEGDLAGGDAGGEGPDADAEAEAAGEEEEEFQPGDGDAEPPGSVAARQEDDGADEDLSQAPRRTAPHPVAPPSSGPAAWLCRYCKHDTTPFGDTVTSMCQARRAAGLLLAPGLPARRGRAQRGSARADGPALAVGVPLVPRWRRRP